MFPTENLTKSSPVSLLPGVGEKRAAAFARMGIETLWDLLLHFPRAYEDRGNVRPLMEVGDGEIGSFVLTVACEARTALIRRGMQVTKFRAYDASGNAEIVFFNQPYLRDVFHTGAVFRFYGKLSRAHRASRLTSPAYEPLRPGEMLPDLIPKYGLSDGLTQKSVQSAVSGALRALLPALPDYLPEEIRRAREFPVLSYALENIHAPRDREALARALRRTVFDELYCFSLGIAESRLRRQGEHSLPCPPADLAPFLSLLPYRLTAAQERVLSEIRADMAGGDRPAMNRLLVGDVGSGKTVCAAGAIYTAVRGGYQAALMVPTEILARQHAGDLAPLFEKLGIRTALLLGATPQKERHATLAAVAAGEVDVLIGTHALLGDGVRFCRLGLTVTDEQHRFGVRQRARLSQKQTGAHLLVMSATPIPRTLALTVYGDLDISRIDEMPKGRQRVSTYVVDEGYRDRLNGFIRRQVEEGGQVYIVCPAVEEQEAEENEEGDLPLTSLALTVGHHEEQPPLKAATTYAANLRETVFPDLRVDFVHGKMKSSEKEDVMRRFAAGEIDILVSTTVIEVGVNVPRASLMVVENAERFGLSQLHQLRGRVGRGNRKSYCVLVSDAKGESAKARLEVMRTTYDGYAIAEKDLEQRGPGDFFAAAGQSGLRQSGGLSLRLACLCSDEGLMQEAASDARATLARDPDLSLPEHAALRAEVRRLFTVQEGTIS